MKQVNNGYAEYYFLTEEGIVYNKKLNRKLKADPDNRFTLKREDNTYKKVSLKELYKLVYNEIYCIDDIEDLDQEEWREIKGSQKVYWISSKGRVKSKAGYKAKILKTTATNGYEKVDIMIEGQRQTRLVHRLVAAAFLMQPEDIEMQIHHKDFNKYNNNADNLEWVTKQKHSKIHKERKEQKNND